MTYRDGGVERVGRIVLSGGEALHEATRERVTYRAIAALAARYRDRGGVRLVLQTTGDLLTPAIVAELLARGVWMISVAGVDDFHVGLEGAERQARFTARLAAMFEAAGMRRSGGQAPVRAWHEEEGPVYGFFGATPEMWIGKLWPRGRAWENSLSTATLADNFCARWSGGAGFLRHGEAGSEVSIAPDGSVYPCCLKTKVPIGSLLEERLTDMLDDLAADPVFQAIDAGVPQRMGLSDGWSEEDFIASSRTVMPDGRPYANLCIGCDRFHEQVLAPRIAAARARRLAGSKPPEISRRAVLGALAVAPFADWSATLRTAAGGSVFWNAWGGDDRTNGFIAWAATRLQAQHGIAVHHVRLRDTAEAVARVVAEKAAGRLDGGSVDLIWLNGPNFLSMRQQNLLFGPVLDLLPNAGLIDRTGKPATLVDFTVPTEGFEVPWRMAQIVFIRDAARVPEPPRSMRAMPDWAAAHPGRLAHPQVRNFLGATFLKQALVELTPDRAALQRPAGEGFAAATAPLWDWYAALRGHLWRRGTVFPESGPAMRALLNDGEIDIMISFNPAEAALGIASGTLPDSARVFLPAGGTIGNCSFNAIPFNAANPAGAMVLADFLLSPEAQAQAADLRVLGSPTVLALDRLSPADRARFAALPSSPAMPDAAELGTPLPEPHPSWMTGLVPAWEARFGA